MKIKLTFERCGRTGVTPKGTVVEVELRGLDEDSSEQEVLDGVAAAVHRGRSVR